MIHIDFQEPTTGEWKAWCDLCDKEQIAHNAAISQGKPSKVKSNVYKGQEHVYMNPSGPFHGKCAYCEKRIYSDQHGDIEHFRPKAGLKDDKTGKPIKCQVGGNTQDHPGYYWLAYDWRNLLPSCVLCNQPSSGHSSYPIGKRNYFPVIGTHATRPGDEAGERPLLIHPVLEYPEDHLEVDETGVFHAKNESLRGETCIRIFGLNERGLPDERKRTYRSVRDKVSVILVGLSSYSPSSGDVKGKLEEIDRIKQGFDEFTAIARKAILDSKKDCSPIFED